MDDKIILKGIIYSVLLLSVLGLTPGTHQAWAQGPIIYPNETAFYGAARQSPLNGHWYVLGKTTMTWDNARSFADNTSLRGRWSGHLATIHSLEENDQIRMLLSFPSSTAWLGGRQAPGYSAAEGWSWTTGESWSYTNWNSGYPAEGGDDALELYTSTGKWRDRSAASARSALVEFDMPAAVSPQPAINPETLHAYELIADSTPFDDARSGAGRRRFWGVPGHLATVTSAEEGLWLTSHVDFPSWPVAWIGGQRIPDSTDPRAGWQWVTGEDWDFERWLAGEPEDATVPWEICLAMHGTGIWGWSDEPPTQTLPYVVEYDLPAPSNQGNVVLGFDGKNHWAALSQSASFTIPSRFSVECWVKPEPGKRPLQMLLTNKGQSMIGARGFALFLLDDGVSGYLPSFSVAGKSLISSSFSVPYHQWRHILAVLDGASMRLYVNGVLAGRADSLTHAVVNGNESMVVGADARDADSQFRGWMDEIRIWTTVRNEEDLEFAYGEYLLLNLPLADLYAYFPITLDDLGGIQDRAGGSHPMEIWDDKAGRQSTLPVLLSGDLALAPPLPIDASSEIVPRNPTAWDDLVCLVHINNPDNRPLTTSYEWRRDGQLLSSPLLVDGQLLPVTGMRLAAAYLRRRNAFTCRARISDGSSYRLRTTAPVVVGNATPSAPEVHIVPDDPDPWDGLGAEFLTYSVDPDGDPIGYEIRWYRSQDGGANFVFRVELSGILPLGNWVPPAYLRDGDIWRVEAIPFEVHVSKAGGQAGAAETRVDGESAWDQVYVGTNQHPDVVILAPHGSDLVAYPGATIVWQASDPDGDPVSVSLWYRDAEGVGTEHLLAADLPPNGSLLWSPPGAAAAVRPSDLYADGLVDLLDVLLLASHWGEYTDGQHYRIVARAFDSRKALERVQSDAAVVVPDAFPMDADGLMRILDAWHGEE